MALGGCLKAPPIDFGVTADSGGHLAYVIEAALAQAANAKEHRITIVTRKFAEDHLPLDHSLFSEMVADRVAINRIETTSARYLEKEALAAELPSFIEEFCQYLSQLSALPDVIHAHFADAAEVAFEARKRFGIPVVYTPHALAVDKRDQGLGGVELDARIEMERNAIAGSDALIVSTRDEADRQVRAYQVAVGDRIHCIAPSVPQRPRPVAEDPLTERLSAELDRPHLPIILAIARPVAKKNLVGLAQAYAGDPALQTLANLVILAGQDDGRAGEEESATRDALHRVCGTPELRRRVMLPARHTAHDVTAFYERAGQGGVFVNPALHEPFGLTLIEAAEAGVPVVATCHGGPKEIVAAIGHGLLIDPRDTPAIAAACRAIIADPVVHKQFRAAALANHARYDWARYAAESVAVYRSLLRRPALLACDIDSTLTGCMTSAVAFATWRRASTLPFVVATGRSFDEARKVIAQWHLPEPDAFITDVGTTLMLKGEGGTWIPCESFSAALDADWDLLAIRAALAPLAIRPQPETTAGRHKLSFFGSAQDATLITLKLVEGSLAARVIFSHGNLIDVLAPRGGKAAAIATYASRIGLTLASCVVAGDSGNDRDMLEQCGQAIVVGNAGEELAGLAPRSGLYRAERSYAAGVLEGLERLGLVTDALKIAA